MPATIISPAFVPVDRKSKADFAYLGAKIGLLPISEYTVQRFGGKVLFLKRKHSE